MPLYDFKCTKCDKEFDQQVKLDEADKVKCSCGGKAKRLISNPSHYKHLSWSKWRMGS